MLRTLFLIPALIAMAACSSTSGTAPPGPVTPIEVVTGGPVVIANRTLADEEAMRGAELAYKLARSLGEVAVDAGLIKGAVAVRVADLDTRLFAALNAARTAYAAFNSSGLISAAAEVRRLAAQIETLTKGDVR